MRRKLYGLYHHLCDGQKALRVSSIKPVVSVGWRRSVRWRVFVGKVGRPEMENGEQLVSANCRLSCFSNQWQVKAPDQPFNVELRAARFCAVPLERRVMWLI